MADIKYIDSLEVEGRFGELKKKFDLMESFLVHKGLVDEFDSFALSISSVTTKSITKKRSAADFSLEEAKQDEAEGSKKKILHNRKNDSTDSNGAGAGAVNGNKVEDLPSTLRELEQRSYRIVPRTKQTARKPNGGSGGAPRKQFATKPARIIHHRPLN